MSGFSSEWLALREPADRQARDNSLPGQIVQWHGKQSGLRVFDFGAGSGANFRFTAPCLGAGQDWLLLDYDAALLGGIYGLLRQWAQESGYDFSAPGDACLIEGPDFDAKIRTRQIDLSTDLGCLGFDECDLATGSALLDLVSARWIESLADACVSHNCAAYFSLNYNGLASWCPEQTLDSEIVAAFNQHQLKNKSFGPALGPGAIRVFAEAFVKRGFDIVEADSPWLLGPERYSLLEPLLQGWAEAVGEVDAGLLSGLRAWLLMRLEAARREGSVMTVGHADLLALPA